MTMRWRDLSSEERALVRLMAEQDHWPLRALRKRPGAVLARLHHKGLVRYRIVHDGDASTAGLTDVALLMFHNAEVGA
jgi:hypothetical protein